MAEIKLPQRPVMGAVILYPQLYDEAKRQGYNMDCFIRGAPIPMTGPAAETRQQQRRMERDGLAARKKLGKWAKRGSK